MKNLNHPLARVIAVLAWTALVLGGLLSGEGPAVAAPLSAADTGTEFDLAALLAAPAAPQAVGDFILEPVEIGGGSQSVFGVAGSQAYAFSGKRLLQHDISNPSQPWMLSQFIPYPGETINAAALYQNRFAFVLTGSRFAVLDISAFSQPVFLTEFSNPGWYRLHIHNNLLVLAGSNLMNIYQINSPSSVVSLSGTSFTEYATRDVFVASRYYRAMHDRLEVVDFSDPLAIKSYTHTYTLAWDLYGMAVRPPYVILHGYIEDRGYALYSLDLTDVSKPKVLYTGDSHYGDNMTAVGNYGYACSGGDLQIFDLSDPAHPHYLGQPQHACGNTGFLSGNRYYSGSAIFDITNPAYPKLLGHMPHGLPVDQVLGGSAAADSSRAYTFGYGWLNIFEVSGPTWRHLSGLNLNSMFFSEIYTVHPYIFLLDYDGLFIINISNPFAPVMVGAYDLFSSSPQAVAYHDAGAQDYLYVADYDTLMAINITNPLDPAATVVTAEINLSSSASNLAISSGKLFVGMGGNGILVYSLSNPASPSYLGAEPGTTYQLAVKGNRLFVGGGSNVRVLDTSVFPLVEKALLPGYGNHLLVYGNLLYQNYGNVITLYDITNPDSARWISSGQFSAYGSFFSAGGNIYLREDNDLITYLRPKPVESQRVNRSIGQFTAADGSFSMDFPACVVSEDQVLFESFAAPLPLVMPEGVVKVRPVMDFAFAYPSGYIGGANCSFTLQVHYTAQDVTGLDESSLAVYYWVNSWTGTDWVKEPTSTLDTANRVVTAQIPTGIQRWGLFAEMAPTSLQPLYLSMTQSAYPVSTYTNPTSLDLSVQRIEPIQVVNPAGGLSPLVAGKPTAVRVYLASGAASPVVGVRLALHGVRNNVPLPGSPLYISNATVMPGSMSENFGTTVNVSLPESWLGSGPLTLTAVVDDAGWFKETNEGNNGLETTVTFNDLAPLNIVFVPINYTHTPTGDVYPPAENMDLSYDLRQLFPIPGVTISYHAPVSWAGNLSDGGQFSALLSFIREVKDSDDAPSSTLYYGVIPTKNPAGTKYSPAWGGMGYLGSRTAIGLNGGISTFAHESGHNLGLSHAPCGGAGGPDPNFPYADGRIGQLGVSGATLASFNPVVTKDFMTYCGPEWISDYYYQKLYNNQSAVSSLSTHSAAIQDVYVLRAFIEDDGLSLLPTYRADRAQLPLVSDSDYWVEVRDAAGQLLARANLLETRIATEDQGGQGPERMLSGRAPALPGAARLVLRSANGDVQAEQLLIQEPDSALQNAAVQFDGEIQTLAWPGASGLLRVSIRQSSSQPWQLYALDWPAELPLALPAGQWQVQWSQAGSAAPNSSLAP